MANFKKPKNRAEFAKLRLVFLSNENSQFEENKLNSLVNNP